ncbi:MAG TPA: DedA family protein [Planctomycetota bacterium]|nr:DedA family protein [Planctomycetota bacterium]
MEALKEFIDVLLHLDKHLLEWIDLYQQGVYWILIAIVFCETGLVVTPFLPGDSLLFAAGACAALGKLDLALIFVGLVSAAFAGDNLNYWVGKRLGRGGAARIPRLIKPHYLEKTDAFYARHGGKTIILARFVPIVRTFAPFVAGVGRMNYGRFLAYSISGAILWVGVCTLAGYFFGNLEFVKKNFSLVVLAIILISVLPIAIGWWRSRGKAGAAATDRIPD